MPSSKQEADQKAVVLIGNQKLSKPDRHDSPLPTSSLLPVTSGHRADSSPSTNGQYRFRDRSKSPFCASSQISAQMACPLAWATGSSKRPIRLMKWSRPPNLNLTWRAPLLSLTLGGFFSISLPCMGFGLRADAPQKPSQISRSSSPS